VSSQRPVALVADDDEELRVLLAAALRREGFDVVEAGDGEELLEAVLGKAPDHVRHSPDVIVSDVLMPKCTGLSALASLRQQKVDIPFVLVSASGDLETRQAGRRLGAAAVIEKPFTIQRLRDVIRAVFDGITPPGLLNRFA
jgi:two-component system, response regulator, stage 0 sporulation protein F